jgi:hypothetical protein
MKKYVEARRRAQKNFMERMYQNGYKRTTIWVHQTVLKTLQDEASKEGTTLQALAAQLLEQRAQKTKG